MKLKQGFAVLAFCLACVTGAEPPDSYYDAVLVDLKNEKSASHLQMATQAQIDAFINAQKLNGPRQATVLHYEVFPDNRYNASILVDDIPEKWLNYSLAERRTFADTANPGEYYMFQVGVFAMRQDCIDIRAAVSELTNPVGDVIPEGVSFCLNTDGSDIYGQPFRRKVDVPQGKLQVLWFGIKIPDTAKGDYLGKVRISPRNAREITVDLKLKIEGKVLADHGVSRDRTLARLHWLNSTAGIDETVTTSFSPLAVENTIFSTNRTIRLTGKEIDVNRTGMIDAFRSSFTGANTEIKVKQRAPKPMDVLAEPMRFEIETTEGVVTLKPVSFEVVKETDAEFAWKSICENKMLRLTCHGTLGFDGFATQRFELLAHKDVRIKDVRLVQMFTPKMSKYMMGLGLMGGLRPVTHRWRWNVDSTAQESVWIGGVNGGIRTRFLAENSHDRLVNIYSFYGPLRSPVCWENYGKGGIDITTRTDGGATLTAYSGARSMLAGETEIFRTEMNLTPFKYVDQKQMFADRYHHPHNFRGFEFPAIFDTMEKEGANILVCHHSNNEVNPWLNYPLRRENVALGVLRAAEAHARNLLFKIYYTARELSIHTPEFPALLALNDEIVYPGPSKDVRTVLHTNGPMKWLTTHLKRNFIPAWPDRIRSGTHKGAQDITVIVTPESRYGNFYVASIDYYARTTGFDGLYIDDCSLNRIIFQRTRRVLEKANPKNARINMHTCNHYTDRYGWEPCINLYMSLMPYIDMMWLGEGRNPDVGDQHYWLIESTGIPYGCWGQMLQSGGNPWRGMLYGMTARAAWSVKIHPKFMWQFWDAFGMQDCEMIGFWDDECPVTTDNPAVPVTVYLGENKAAIAVASWVSADTVCNLVIDWQKLGLDPTQCDIVIPEIGGGYQSAQNVDLTQPLKIPAKKGYIITLTQKRD